MIKCYLNEKQKNRFQFHTFNTMWTTLQMGSYRIMSFLKRVVVAVSFFSLSIEWLWKKSTLLLEISPRWKKLCMKLIELPNEIVYLVIELHGNRAIFNQFDGVLVEFKCENLLKNWLKMFDQVVNHYIHCSHNFFRDWEIFMFLLMKYAFWIS